MKRIGWVLGWAVPEAWFAPLVRAVFPNSTHILVSAAPDALARLELTGPFDWVAGYSLGAQLLLGEATRAGKLGRVALLAPMFAFPSEAGMGGKVARGQVKYLARWLRRDRHGALADFYTRAGFDIPPEHTQDMLHLLPEILTWGLSQLENTALPATLPIGWRAWIGSNDPLLDATKLRALAPEITIVPGATHHPVALLRAFAEEAT